MNFWGFTPVFFRNLENKFKTFIGQNAGNIKAELYLPFVVDELIQSREATVKVLRSTDKWFGVTYKEDKPMVVDKIKSLIQDGVYPPKLW